MPIQFRCEHCNQFLGISRSKAGETVDCPMCGCTTRVPELDGTRRAADTSASGSGADLDEEVVAALGHLGTGSPLPGGAPFSARSPLPVAGQSTGSNSTRTADVLQELTGHRAHRKRAAVLVTREQLILAALAGFAFGAVAGAGGAIWWRDINPLKRTSSVADGTGVAPPTADGGAATAESPAVTQTLTGRILFVSDLREVRPDRTARIFVLPSPRRGTIKLSSQGARGGDESDDTAAVQAALAAWGGAFVIADDEGNFEATLPATGEYDVVIVSRFASSAAPPTPAISSLEDYFQSPQEIVGRTATHVVRLNASTESPLPLEHTFGER